MTCNRLGRRQLAIVTALFAAFGATAYAQGPGPGAHGHRGHHGAHVEQVIAQVKDRLGLNTSQQVMFDNALALTKSAREAARPERERIRAAMKAELAKAEPDLAALAAVADDARSKGQALRRQVRDEWLKLYATFTPAQKQVVRDELVKRMERFEGFRAKMKERWGGGKG